MQRGHPGHNTRQTNICRYSLMDPLALAVYRPELTGFHVKLVTAAGSFAVMRVAALLGSNRSTV